jgi:hypothetical protein
MHGSIATGRPLSIEVSSPRVGELYVDRVRLTIRISGANGSFVRTPLGVPRRITVRVNEMDYPYLSDQWVDDGTALAFNADITVQSADLRPLRATVASAPSVVEDEVMPAGTVLRFVDTEDGARSQRVTGPEAARLVENAVEDVIVIHNATVRLRFDGPAWDTWAGPTVSAVRTPMGAVATLRRSGNLPDEGEIANRFERDLDVHWDNPREPSQPPPLLGKRGLNVIQVSVSDGKSVEPQHAAVTFYITTAQAPAGGITVGPVVPNPPGEDVAGGEHVVIRSNRSAPTDMTGWTLVDFGERHRFTFERPFVLGGQRELRVWTGQGADDASNLYWGRRAAVWNNPGDVAILRNASGEEVGRYAYGRGR